MGTTNQISDVYAGADIFCLPSHSEGFPLALCEAMSAGLPCVGLRECTAVDYLIGTNRAGYLTKNSPEELADALGNLIEDANLRKELGQNGKKAMEAYRPEKIWAAWEKLLQSVVK